MKKSGTMQREENEGGGDFPDMSPQGFEEAWLSEMPRRFDLVFSEGLFLCYQ